MVIVILIVSVYIIIMGVVGFFIKKIGEDRDWYMPEFPMIFGGIFWPITVLVIAGVSIAEYTYKKLTKK